MAKLTSTSIALLLCSTATLQGCKKSGPTPTPPSPTDCSTLTDSSDCNKNNKVCEWVPAGQGTCTDDKKKREIFFDDNVENCGKFGGEYEFVCKIDKCAETVLREMSFAEFKNNKLAVSLLMPNKDGTAPENETERCTAVATYTGPISDKVQFTSLKNCVYYDSQFFVTEKDFPKFKVLLNAGSFAAEKCTAIPGCTIDSSTKSPVCVAPKNKPCKKFYGNTVHQCPSYCAFQSATQAANAPGRCMDMPKHSGECVLADSKNNTCTTFEKDGTTKADKQAGDYCVFTANKVGLCKNIVY